MYGTTNDVKGRQWALSSKGGHSPGATAGSKKQEATAIAKETATATTKATAAATATSTVEREIWRRGLIGINPPHLWHHAVQRVT